MSLKGRLFRLARSNWTAWIRPSGVDALSDAELEAELRRRSEAREREAKAGPTPGDGGRRRRPGEPSRENRIAQYYAQLEVPYGSDLDTVKSAYRRLMRKYHPDLHSTDLEKQKIATELSQALTQAYQELEVALKVSGP